MDGHGRRCPATARTRRRPCTLPAAGYYIYRESIAESEADRGHLRRECGEATETTLAKAAPAVTTVASDAVIKPDGQLSDTLKVTGPGQDAGRRHRRPVRPVRLARRHRLRRHAVLDGHGRRHRRRHVPVAQGHDPPRRLLRLPRAHRGLGDRHRGPGRVRGRGRDVARRAADPRRPRRQRGRGRAPSQAGAPNARDARPAAASTRAVNAVGIDLKAGALGIPADIKKVGWWRDGAAPGDETGTVLIAGHVDSAKKGAGAFYALKSRPPRRHREGRQPPLPRHVGQAACSRAALPDEHLHPQRLTEARARHVRRAVRRRRSATTATT